MPKDRPTNPDPEGFRPLPKPIQLDLPTQERPKPKKRLHEPPPSHIHQAPDYDYPQPEDEPPRRRKPPKPEQNRPTGKRYFNSAQKAYGQRRPRQPKPVKPEKPRRKPKQQQGPRLGRGDRLYTPPSREPTVAQRIGRALKYWALGLLAIALIVLIIINMFNHNAWAVYLNERFVGNMPINREVETSSVHEEAVRLLSDSLGAEIRVNEQTRVSTVRARRGEITDTHILIHELSNLFTYQIVASAIYVGGERVAILRNTQDAQHVANELMRPFRTSYTVDATFEEGWQLREVLADQDELDVPSEVIHLLERPVRDIIVHIIRDGDTQGRLAIEFGTTIERIGYLNNITADAILRVGNPLRIEVSRPRLTVVTIDEITITEEVPMDVETIQNPNLHVSVRNVQVEGRPGERSVTQRITRRNNIQVGSPEIVSSRILREPVTRVIEEGTSTTAVEVR